MFYEKKKSHQNQQQMTAIKMEQLRQLPLVSGTLALNSSPHHLQAE
jgi:hypothetical protein